MSETPPNPFVGLRSFEPAESRLFHGRQLHTQQLLRTLAAHRLVGVMGTSGSGKSSLVKAGLLPALYRGYLRGASSRWKTMVMRPGAAPLTRLAECLAQTFPGLIPSPLAAHSATLVEAVAPHLDRESENLLLVVDQFEELFRQQASVDIQREAAFFVALLLQAAQQLEVPIYVVLTMRSEFLGECAQHPRLSEVLSEAQYLIPRLTRDQLEEAIRGPLEMAGTMVEDALVQQLLNDAGHDPDQLPALQHALMRLYAERASGQPLTLALYEQHRARLGVGRSLDTHATETMRGLPAETVEKVFRCLTTVEDGREIRRPATLGTLYAVVGERAPVLAVVEAYARREHSLLFVNTGHAFNDRSEVDITHESLIRQWGPLREWVRQEADSASWFRRLAESARLWQASEAGLWRNPDLAIALKRAQHWNEAWAHQYTPPASDTWRRTQTFLAHSQAAVEEEQQAEARRATELEDSRQKQVQAAESLAAAAQREATGAQRELSAGQKRRRQLIALLTVLALLAAGLGYSTWRWRALEGQVDALRQGGSESQLQVIADLRNELAKRSGVKTGQVKPNPKDGVRYVYIEPGEFLMGCSPGDQDCEGTGEKPLHRVRLTRAFWIGQTEVTQSAYQRVTGNNPSQFKGVDRPVENVDWAEAGAYCRTVGLRLPTEAEWEYAARAGNPQSRYGVIDEVAWYGNSKGSTQPVAAKKPNAWGLYDMLGNVWEWNADWYGSGYYGTFPTENPLGPGAGTQRVLRGGSWIYDPQDVRVSYRYRVGPTYRGSDIGFRCAGEFH